MLSFFREHRSSIHADTIYRPHSIVKLVQNFRSHPVILSFPNNVFYRGDLRACGDPHTIEAYLGSSLLPTKSFPIVFRAVSGQDAREGFWCG